MFCPNNETLQSLTEKTKLLAQKCSQQIRVSMDQTASGQQVSSFKSYLNENEPEQAAETCDAPTSPTINCIAANISSINRLIKERCNNILTSTQYSCNTLPRMRPKSGTTKWYIKVSV
jgi:hypothetical protein